MNRKPTPFYHSDNSVDSIACSANLEGSTRDETETQHANDVGEEKGFEFFVIRRIQKTAGADMKGSGARAKSF